MANRMDLSPEKEYRPASFWALDGELKEDELKRQIEAFKEAGWGGFFMHARGNLKTPYLSRQFMEKIKFCVKTAKSLGLDAWIYDELDWPSGSAGGMVLKHGAQNSACHIVRKKAEDDSRAAGELCRRDGYVYCREYGCGTNELSLSAVNDFIEITHENYKDKIGDEFGKTVPGVFFDEPQYANYYEPNDYIPWGDALPEMYEKLWNESVFDIFPSLFENTGDYIRARKRFWYTLTKLYTETFGRTLYDWCEKNGLKLTGHYEWEENFYAQIRCTGDIMSHYEFMHIPGNDSLGRGMFAPWIYLETASVAAQLGKERVMTECFGVGGQNMDLHTKRLVYGNLLALGVNFFSPHITLYSLRGESKRDCPPDNNYIQPWWKYARPLEDSVSRASKILANAKKTTNILVLYPIVTAWCNYFPGNREPLDLLQGRFEALFYKLYDNGVYFHYGDELIMENHASVKDGKLVIGNMEYDTVVLPYVEQTLDKTKALLKEFAAAGGKLYSLSEQGGTAGALAEAAENLDNSDELLEKLKKEYPAVFESSDRHWVLPFENALGKGWFISNPERFADIALTYVGKTPAVLLDTQGMTETALFSGDSFTIPAAGFVIVEDLTAEEAKNAVRTEKPEHFGTVRIDGEWRVSSSAHGSEFKNVANLDFCALRLDGGQWSEPIYTRDAAEIIKAEAAKRGPSGHWLNTRRLNTRYQLKFKFRNESSAKKFILCAEDADTLGFTINGRTAEFKDDGYFLDCAIRRFDISDYIVSGENEVILAGLTGPDFVVEDIYLLGDFSVRLEGVNTRVLGDLPTSIISGNLESQGFTFLSGEISLENRVNVREPFCRAVLKLISPHVAAAAVEVNSAECGATIAAPYEVDITGALRSGENSVKVTVATSLQNLLGPLHTTKIDPKSISQPDYNDKENWTDAPNLVPFGFEACEIWLYR